MPLPVDSHVHTNWSWDAPHGSMRASCERAIRVGLPAIAFTEHVDHTVWRVAMEELDPGDHLAQVARDGLLHPPAFDAAGYLQEVEECRERYPGLRILSGLELGEPHRHPEVVAGLLARGTFDRVLGSLHSLADGGQYAEPVGLYGHRDPAEVLRSYLAEVTVLVASDQSFEVLAHIDYPVRGWPPSAGRFDPLAFEAEFRHALHVTATSGRALEVNTKVPLHARILQWWREEGGTAITFGSDAHAPESIAHHFTQAAQMADAHGFRPGRMPHDLWGRA
ncbi:PHP domain-containing protein [Nocardioides sp. Soil805]|uniref:PHP domain-containing protein n=1 Tax=Nocardioides sp. Soil805 TaxID=1736416 RepID=UPI0007024FAC|nr:PHP domain-containing protein [Nocardioides sp. Soil805]KRF34179.1 histidinol phosphatase [Nocardioides sp. Soil805]